MAILLTGCAGYIGSIASQLLIENGFEVVGIDNLSRNKKDNIPAEVNFYQACISDKDTLAKITAKHKIDAVMHFAAFIEVSESVKHPELFKQNNYENTVKFIENMRSFNINRFIFSSTAAVYGNPKNQGEDTELMLKEDIELNPINPYGQYKLDVERHLEQVRAQSNDEFEYVVFRYFNVAGAYGKLGECHDPETHVIPIAIDTVLGLRENFSVFGTDYPTPDGSAVRDYVHVVDLANAHIEAVKLFDSKPECLNQAYNIGYGEGFSVKQIVEAIERVCGKKMPIKLAERRSGDPASLVASNEKAIKAEVFKPSLNSIDKIIKDAFEHRKIFKNIDQNQYAKL